MLVLNANFGIKDFIQIFLQFMCCLVNCWDSNYINQLYSTVDEHNSIIVSVLQKFSVDGGKVHTGSTVCCGGLPNTAYKEHARGW